MGEQPPDRYYGHCQDNNWHQGNMESVEEEGNSREVNPTMPQNQMYGVPGYAMAPNSAYMYQQDPTTSHPESYVDQPYATSSSNLRSSWPTPGSTSPMYVGPSNFQYRNTPQSNFSIPHPNTESSEPSYTTRQWPQQTTGYPTVVETPQPRTVRYDQNQYAPASSTAQSGEMYPRSSQARTPTNLQPPSNTSDYEVYCPYGCGTVLKGVHAVGNLTRHMKSRKCPNSPREKRDFPCPHGCDRSYARSDGLKVHLRKHHGAPPASPRYEPEEGA